MSKPARPGRARLFKMATRDSVLLIYTGGTIGCLPRDAGDPRSPLVPASLDQVMAMVPHYDATARALRLGEIQVPLETISWTPPIDSSQVTFEHWIQLAREIESRYDQHVGFVVLHGTDTLAFTASALAFMLDGLDKPVVLTGSQLPIGQTRSDAVQNLVTSVEIAAARLLGETVVPEVCVFFRDSLLRGCRTTKVSASSFGAFASPNCPPLGAAGELITLDAPRLRRPGKKLVVHDHLESRIAILDVFPGMSPALLEALLSSGDLRGVVLKTFGTGNVPATTGFLQAIERAVARGIVILDVTQCLSGEVALGLYEASAGLLALGVVGGMDLTPEAALAKLAFVLGQESNPQSAADLVQLDWRGEQQASRLLIHYGGGRLEGGQSIRLSPMLHAGMSVLRNSDHGGHGDMSAQGGAGPSSGTSGSLASESRKHIGDVALHAIKPFVDNLSLYANAGNLEAAAILIAGVETAVPIQLEAHLEAPDGVSHLLGRGRIDAAAPYLLIEATAGVRSRLESLPEGKLTLVSSGPTDITWKRLDLALRVSS